MIDIAKYFKELHTMNIEIPHDPADFHDQFILLTKYRNRVAAMVREIRADMYDYRDDKEIVKQLKNLLDAVSNTQGHLKEVKQAFSLIINNSEVFDKHGAAPNRPLTETDIPGQEFDEFDEF